MEGAIRRPVPPGLTVIETLRLDPDGPVRGGLHLDRMARTAAALGFPFDPGEAERRLDEAKGAQPLRVRLTLRSNGGLGLAASGLPETPALWHVAWAEARVAADDPWRRLKTSARSIYDRARAGMDDGLDELLFLNERGEVAEGTITNVFLAAPDALLTPPVASGALPGVLRQELIDTGRARQARLLPGDFGRGPLFVGNSLRGLISARLLDQKGISSSVSE